MTDLKTGDPALEPGDILARQLEAARLVDRLGYDHLWAWDHLYAIFGDPYQPIFEGWTSLAAFAMATSGPASACSWAPTRSATPGWSPRPRRRSTTSAAAGRSSGIGGAWMEPSTAPTASSSAPASASGSTGCDEAVGAMRGVLDGESVTSAPGGRYQFDDLRHQPLPAPEAPADHDRRHRREEDAADRRDLRGHVERDGPGREDAAQDRGAAGALRRGRARHRRDRVHARREAHDPRLGRRGGRVQHAAMAHNRTPLSESRTTTRSGTAAPRRSPTGCAPTSRSGFRTVISEQPAPYDIETLERFVGEVKPLIDAG